MLALALAGCTAADPAPACPAPRTEPSAETAVALEQRLAALAEADGPTLVTITAAEANAYLQHRLLADGEHTARILFAQDGLCLAAELALAGRMVPATLHADLAADDGVLTVTLEAVSIGQRRLPAFLRRSLQSMLNELLAELGGSASVSSVALHDGSLTLTLERTALR